MHFRLLIVALLTLLIARAIFVVLRQFFKLRQRSSKDRILLAIAHPDDEAMFFLPTLLELRRAHNSSVSVLCFSAGNSKHLGAVRAAELRRNCAALGVQRCDLIDDARLPDGLNEHWPVDYVASLLCAQISRVAATRLVTFDSYGVSGHPNHIALSHAAQLLTLQRTGGTLRSIHLLDSVPLWRKYLGLFDLLFVFGRSMSYVRLDGVLQVHAAMQRHRSQYVWFRRLSVLVSRYSIVNTYTVFDVS